MASGISTLAMLSAVALCVVGSLACSDPNEGTRDWRNAEWPEPLDDDIVVSWRSEDAWGVETYELTRGMHGLHIMNQGEEIVVEREVPPKAIEDLRDELVANSCCELVEHVGDAPAVTSLRVRLPGLSCDVTRATEFWDLDPHARDCEAGLRRLLVRQRPRRRPEGLEDESDEGEAPREDG